MIEAIRQAMEAAQQGRVARYVVEARPPDQRAIAENPQVFAEMFDIELHQSMIPKSGYRFSEKIMLKQEAKA